MNEECPSEIMIHGTKGLCRDSERPAGSEDSTMYFKVEEFTEQTSWGCWESPLRCLDQL